MSDPIERIFLSAPRCRGGGAGGPAPRVRQWVGGAGRARVGGIRGRARRDHRSQGRRRPVEWYGGAPPGAAQPRCTGRRRRARVELHLRSVGQCGDLRRCRPVFVDSDRVSWNMHPGLLSDELADRARSGSLPTAVVVVDLYGQCADYDEIEAVCGRYEVPMIEDSAEALGATYRGPPGRIVRCRLGAVVQRQQDHHHLGWRRVRLARSCDRRPCAVPRHPGP